MPTNQYERDFEDLRSKTRFVGRFDPRLLQNVNDAGDGSPGMQKAIRNWFQHYIHDGIIAQAIDMNNNDINNVKNLIVTTIENEGSSVVFNDDVDLNNNNLDDIATIDGGGNAVQFDDDINLPSNDITLGDGQTVDGVDISAHAANVNAHIDNLTDIPTRTHSSLQGIGTSDHHVKYTDAEARASINDIFGSDGKADSDIDLDSHGINNLDNLDERIYYVATDAEFDNALSDIATNTCAGRIIITEPLSNVQATVNGASSSFVIEGNGDKVVLDANGNNTVITITNCLSCEIRNLKIDASDLTSTVTKIIYVNESNNNPVLIDNVTIVGDGQNGKGVYVDSNNCTISKCNISSVYIGVNLDSDYNIVIGNKCSSIYGTGIYVDNNRSSNVICNYCRSCDTGMAFYGATDCTITGNTCKGNDNMGILLSGITDCTITGNTCNDNDYGIRLYNTSSSCTITGNTCNSNNTCGIILNNTSNCTITGNTCNSNNTNNEQDGGGICVETELSTSNYNTINGNTCNGNANAGAGTGYGINISDSDCNNNSVVGNTCLNNDTNYNNSGTSTFDSTATDGDPLNNIS